MFPGVGLPFLAHTLLSLAQLLPPRHEPIQKNVRGLFLRCALDARTAPSAFMHPMKAKPRPGVFVNGLGRQSMANRPGVNGSRKWEVVWCSVCAPPKPLCLHPENHTAETLLSFIFYNPSMCDSGSFTPTIHYTHSSYCTSV